MALDKQDDFDYDSGERKPRKLKKVQPDAKAKAEAKAAKEKPQSNDAPIGDASSTKLRLFVARIERLEEEKAALMADIKEVYAEAKSFGFDTKVLRKVIAQRKKDQAEVDEQQALFDLYWGAVEGYLEMEREA
jgi:uncharacterized protein (UPF0335 family)